jgi:hypothetical protein
MVLECVLTFPSFLHLITCLFRARCLYGVYLQSLQSDTHTLLQGSGSCTSTFVHRLSRSFAKGSMGQCLRKSNVTNNTITVACNTITVTYNTMAVTNLSTCCTYCSSITIAHAQPNSALMTLLAFRYDRTCTGKTNSITTWSQYCNNIVTTV